MRYRIAQLLIAAMLVCFSGHAWAAPSLFGSFTYGTPKSELAKLPGAAPGEGSFAGDIMLPEATFAGLPWNVRLEFANDRLVRVSLMERYSRERMSAVTRQLASDKFEMLSVLMDSSYLDLVKVLKTTGPESVKGAWADFVKGKKPERMIYAWFDMSGVSANQKTMAADLKNLLMIAPMETREAEVVLLRDAAGSPGMLLVDFSFPVLR